MPSGDQLWGTFAVDDHLRQRAFVAETVLFDHSMSAARRYEASGVDSVLLNFPPDPRQKEAFARGRDTRPDADNGSAEDYGWRLFALWMRSLHRRQMSSESMTVFRDTSNMLFKARLLFLMNSDIRRSYIPRARSHFDDGAYMEFQRLKNLLILGEIGEGGTGKQLTGAYLGYIDAYLKQIGLSASHAGVLLGDERLGEPDFLAAAYGCTGHLDIEIAAARVKGGADYAAIMNVFMVSELASEQAPL